MVAPRGICRRLKPQPQAAKPSLRWAGFLLLIGAIGCVETPTAEKFQFATGAERKAALADVGGIAGDVAAVDTDADAQTDVEDVADVALDVAPDVVADADVPVDVPLDVPPDAVVDTDSGVEVESDVPPDTDATPDAETEVVVDPCASQVCADDNPCTDAYCDPIKGCVFPAVAATCTDGDACTVGDSCKDAVCLAGAVTACDDGNGCTTDSCGKAIGCVNVANAATCTDDGNPCSLDVCAAGVCTHPFAGNQAPCDDKDPCTVPDGCTGGLCMGLSPKNCDDGNPCTDDSCDKAKGCVYLANAVTCSDGDACTEGDGCAAGNCAGGKVKVCDDSNVCTDDNCDKGKGCVYLANAVTCSDGDACTEGDACVNKTCASGKGKTCDDANGCTDDSCDKGKGCVYLANAVTCSDADACTGGDACAGSACKPGAAVKCDDGNVCTTDGCEKGKGCVTAAAVGVCSDGDSCTLSDACAGGVCKPGLLAIWQTKLDVAGKQVGVATSGLVLAYADAVLAVAQVEFAGQSHARAVRIGLDGKPAWTVDLNDPATTWAYLEGILPLGDVRAVLTGMSYPQGKTSVDGVGWVVVLDSAGKKLSEATVATPGYNTRLSRGVKLSDGSLVLIGASAAPSKGNHHDAMLVSASVAADGKVTVGTPKYITAAYPGSFGGAVVEPGDSVALFGRHGSGTNGNGYFVRVDKALNVIGKPAYVADNVTANKDFVSGVAVASGGYLAAGTKLTAPGIYSAWLVRLDANGAILWQKTYGGTGGKQVGALTTADNGDWLLAGYAYEGVDVAKNDRWLLRVDSNGNEVWQRTYAVVGDQRSYSVVALAGGAALMGGLDGKAGSVWRVDGFGYGSCGEAGGCAGKVTVQCNDANSCTADGCLPNGASCSNVLLPDGSPCTLGVCKKGLCTPTICGDGVCSQDETTTCYKDCPCVSQCGIKVCGADGCGGLCGKCATDFSCPSNGAVCVPKTCGDGACGSGETLTNCPKDCSANSCGNGQCDNGETPTTCAKDCGICGNGVCDGAETSDNCAKDCGTCTPNCAGKTCGPNGCGGICGTCTSPKECHVTNGICVNPLCGNSVCGVGETAASCSADCKPHPCDNQCGSKAAGFNCYCDSVCKTQKDCCTAAGGTSTSCAGSTCAACK